jgi:hypothetical protein
MLRSYLAASLIAYKMWDIVFVFGVLDDIPKANAQDPTAKREV